MMGPAPLADRQRLGVRRADGRGLPAGASDAGLVQAGRRHFLVHGNYEAVLHYNCSHHYALAVSLLAERIGAAR
jgi:membrane-bound lytic murein transglycosylase B